MGPGHLRPDHRRPRSAAVARDAGRLARADLLRARGQLRHREPQHPDRPGRGARRAPGPRVRAAQAVPRRPLERGRRADGRQGAAAGPHPHPGRQPDDRRGAHPARRGDARPAGGRAVGARHRRGPGGHAPVRGRHPGSARPAAPPARARLRARRHDRSIRSSGSAGTPPRGSSRRRPSRRPT